MLYDFTSANWGDTMTGFHSKTFNDIDFLPKRNIFNVEYVTNLYI